jgi:hypothetical protein
MNFSVHRNSLVMAAVAAALLASRAWAVDVAETAATDTSETDDALQSVIVTGMFAIEIALLVGLLKVQRNNGQTLVAVLLIQLHQVLRLVVAVRAPRAGHNRQRS